MNIILKEPLVAALVFVTFMEILLVFLELFLRKKVSFNIEFHLEILFSWLIKLIIAIVKILIVLIVISLLYRLRHIWPLSKISEIIQMIIQDKDVSKVILGAFLASVLGILTQVFLRSLNIKKDIRKHSRLLRNEIESLLFYLSSSAHMAKAFKCKEEPTKIFEGHLLEELSYDPKWREYYASLSDELPISYYTLISKIYKSVDQFNKAVKEKDFEALFYSSWQVLSGDNSLPINGISLITSKDLLNMLDALSRNKRIKTRRFYNLYKEILYNNFKKKMFHQVEEEAIRLLKESLENRLERGILEQQIMTWYNGQSQKIKKRYAPIIRRITFEVLMESSNINLIWGDCFLKNE